MPNKQLVVIRVGYSRLPLLGRQLSALNEDYGLAVISLFTEGKPGQIYFFVFSDGPEKTLMAPRKPRQIYFLIALTQRRNSSAEKYLCSQSCSATKSWPPEL